MKEPRYILILFLLGLVISLITGCNSNNSGTKSTQEPNNYSENVVEAGNGIDSLEKVQIGGVEQWIYLKANDKTKPVLLFLHGGPGYSMMPILNLHNSELENYFVVVNWDQRGAGLSYSSKVSKESMTLRQFVSDVHELTNYLKTRFNKEKIYLVGHSFGTVFGMKAIREYPSDYLAFIGVGQVVNIAENEQLSYDFALKSAKEDNNQRAVKQLISVGRPDSNGNYKNYSGYEITMKWIEHYGGDLYGKSSLEELEDEIYNTEIYKNAHEKIEQGLSFSDLLFEDDEVMDLDFRDQIKEVDVPVYFFSGRHDYDTPFELVEKYFNVLSAPKKELVWFENSAHFPFYEEPGKFNRVMIDKVLPETLGTSEIIGKWTGSYSTDQGDTALELEVLSMKDGRYLSEFSFGSSDSNSNTPKGKFKSEVVFDSRDKSIKVNGTEWIERPLGYDMVNLIGNVSDNFISGTVVLQDDISVIGNFSLKREK